MSDLIERAERWKHACPIDASDVITELVDELVSLAEWHKATMPLIAALAVYGDKANLAALVTKARELNEAQPKDMQVSFLARLQAAQEALRETELVARVAITWAPWGNGIELRDRLDAALARAVLVEGERGQEPE